VSRTYVALDLETTGIDPDRDAIIEIGAIKFEGDRVIDTWTSLVDPARPLPYRIQYLTGITPADLNGAPSLFDVLPEVGAFVGTHPVVGHSVPFDLAFLRRHGALVNNDPIDTFELASLLMPHAARYSLVQLASELDIELSSAHRALDDARASKDLFLRLVERLQQFDPQTLEEIRQLAARIEWPLQMVFEDAAREITRTAFTGNIAQQLQARGAWGDDTLGMLVGADDHEPLQPASRLYPLDVNHLARLLDDGGQIATGFPGYEPRPQQMAMLRAVAESFNRGETLLVEAGTGVGKSLAYLVPAIHHAVQNGRRVVISTNTINLQDQLFTKDVPTLANVLGLDVHVAVLKGRSNYLCRHRFDLLRRRNDLTEDEVRLLIKCLAWISSTTTGDMAELPLRGGEWAAWNRVNATVEHCNPDTCPYARDARDYFYRARQRAEAAHVVIVNHALLLSDMVSENRVMPRYEYLIVDEAHHLEAQATSQLGFQCEQSDFDSVLTALTGSSRSDRTGFLGDLAGRIQRSRLSTPAKRRAADHIQVQQQTAERLSNRVFRLFSSIESFVEELAEEGRQTGYHERHYRLTDGLRIQPAWDDVTIAWDNARVALESLLKGLDQLYTSLAGDEAESILQREVLMSELAGFGRRLNELRAGINAIITERAPNDIQWITWHAQRRQLSLNSAPLQIADMLHHNLFASRTATTLTSATLQVNDSFEHIKNRLGLESARELAVGSPFNYRTATLLYVPTDIPEPGQAYYQKTVEKAMVNLGKAVDGRTLALFTSHSQLQATYRAISQPLGQAGIAVLGQGIDGSRAHLLDSFKSEDATVLLGTRSFWEGVDVVGPALSCLVIARLPFDVPTDPIFAARSETFANPFLEYAVPQAVLRFRQGFGRLIRSTTDRGVVVVLDKRVLTKRYGRIFLDSLPACTVRMGPLHELAEAAASWIDEAEMLAGQGWPAQPNRWDEEYF
jgi:predicted DnaQ family exonuclease/DinG family helicase